MSNYSADVKARSTVTETELTTIPDADARIMHLEAVVLALAETVDGLTGGDVAAALATYATSAGTADTATTATKLGSDTVGSGTKPIYLYSGTATASASTVGDSDTPVYLKSGTITACSTSLSDLASGWTPDYSSAASRTSATTYTPSTNGYIMFVASAAVASDSESDGTTATVVTIDGSTFTLIDYDDRVYMLPIGSGTSYKVSYPHSNTTSVENTSSKYKWIPCS